LAYVGTDLKNSADELTPVSDGAKNVGKNGLVFSISKTF